MSIVVNTNLSSLGVQHNLNLSTKALKTSMERLSTGIRINSAADDAAGLSLSEKLKSSISSSDVAKNNALTGINMLQTVEGDLDIIQQNLQRMRDLSVQAANGVYSSSERKMLNAEFQNRAIEIDRIAKNSRFSDVNLLKSDLAADTFVLQVGTDSSSDNRIDISSMFKNFQAGNNTMPAISTNAASISTAATALAQISAMSTAISTISVARSAIGSTINRLNSTISRIEIRKANLTAANSVIRDTDIAEETSNLTKQQILQQSAGMLLKQANQSSSLALQLLQ